jgi:maltooligosyltrehalose synthase
LRKKYDVLRHGDYKRVYAEGHVMAFARELDGESIVTVFNTASEAKTVHLPLGKKVKSIFGNPAIDGEQVTVPARSGVVIK